MTSGFKDTSRHWRDTRDRIEKIAAELPGTGYAKMVRELGLNRATDLETASVAYSDLWSIDMRRYQGDDELKAALVEAQEAAMRLSQILYDRWFDRDR